MKIWLKGTLGNEPQQDIWKITMSLELSNEVIDTINETVAAQAKVRKHKYYLSVKDNRKKEWDKKYYDKHKDDESKKLRVREYRKNNIQKLNEQDKLRQRKYIAELSNSYLRSLIRKKQNLIPDEDSLLLKKTIILIIRWMRGELKHNQLTQLKELVIKHRGINNEKRY